MQPHLLLAVDALGDTHIQTIVNSIRNWATWERIPETASAEEYRAKLATAEIMIGWPEAEWLLNSSIKLLLCPSVGYETYLRKGLETKRDFILCNAGGVYSEGVAEHCLAMMMALTRRLPEYLRAMQSKKWVQLPAHAELAGATVCIVGLGSIGTALARRCIALGMTVTGVRRNPKLDHDAVKQVYAQQQLAEAVAKADHVVSTLPGGEATAHVFNCDIFDAMKAGSYFYNVGRGSVVDEFELVRHLQNGHLIGAGLDVFEEEPLPATSPLWAMDNVILTPHMAGYTADYADRLCALWIKNLHNYRDGKPLINVVNLERGDS
jgi:phosphoglycerate dehydrogenase-like enzyme